MKRCCILLLVVLSLNTFAQENESLLGNFVQRYVNEPVSATVLAGHGLGYLCKGKIMKPQ